MKCFSIQVYVKALLSYIAVCLFLLLPASVSFALTLSPGDVLTIYFHHAKYDGSQQTWNPVVPPTEYNFYMFHLQTAFQGGANGGWVGSPTGVARLLDANNSLLGVDEGTPYYEGYSFQLSFAFTSLASPSFWIQPTTVDFSPVWGSLTEQRLEIMLTSGEVTFDFMNMPPVSDGGHFRTDTNINPLENSGIKSLVDEMWFNGQSVPFYCDSDKSTPVPEPATIFLLGTGMAFFVGKRSRGKK